jgi:hypothetical protein
MGACARLAPQAESIQLMNKPEFTGDSIAFFKAKRRAIRKQKTATHGGKRKGAGRKPALFPLFLKKLRATDEERAEFMSKLTGDARRDFVIILEALRSR